MEYAREAGISDTNIDSFIYDEIRECYSCDILNVETILEHYDFCYFHVAIKPGYYEGFTLDIENNYPIAFDDYIDKRDAQKEITQLKKCLIDCAGVGLVSCSPGWCTGYKDYTETVEDIKAAIRDIREEVKHTPTWRQYNKQCA